MQWLERLAPAGEAPVESGARQPRALSAPDSETNQGPVQPRSPVRRTRTDENLSPSCRASTKKKTWRSAEASNGIRAACTPEAPAADAAAGGGGGGSSSSSSAPRPVGASPRVAVAAPRGAPPPPCPQPLAPTSLRLHGPAADADVHFSQGAGAAFEGGPSTWAGKAHVGRTPPRDEAFTVRRPKAAAAAPEEAPEPIDDERLERVVSGILDRVQWHLEAAQASSDALQGRIDKVRAALESDALERALEVALDHVLPAALQKAAQAFPGDGSHCLAKMQTLPGQGLPLHLRRGGSGDSKSAVVRHVISPGLSRQESPCASRGLVAAAHKAPHNVEEGQPSNPLEDLRLERGYTSSSGLCVLCKSGSGALENESANDASSASRRVQSSADVDMSCLHMEACKGQDSDNDDSAEGDQGKIVIQTSPQSSDGHLALGQWGGRNSATSSFMSRLRSMVSADMEKMTFVSRLQRQDQGPSRVRPSFREQRMSEQDNGDSDQDEADGDAIGPRKSEHKKSNRSSRMSTLTMGRTRSQSRRSKHWLNTRKARLVLSVCTFLVVVNAIWVGLRSHYVMRSELIRHGVQVTWNWAGLPKYQTAVANNSTQVAANIAAVVDGEGWGHPLLDGVFTLLFIFEFCTRLWLYRWDFIFGEHWRWNAFDGILIIVTVVHWFVNVLLIDAMNVDITRLPRVTFLRILRLPRVAIDFSHLDCIHSLQLMTASILHSLTFSWVAFAVIICIIYLFSVCFVQGIIDSLEGAAVGSIKDEDLASIASKFGSVQITLLSLFQAISGGVDWVELMGPLSLAPWRYTLLLFFYIFVVVFGVLNIVTSMFVECVCQVTKEDYKERIRTELLAQKRWQDQLRTIFTEADEDESGSLSWNEFSSLVNVPMMRAYFTTLELNIEEAKEIFEYLDVQGEGEVNMQDFVRGCVCLRGEAKSVDVAVLRSQWQRTSRQLSEDMRNITRLVEQHVERLAATLGSQPDSPRRIDAVDHRSTIMSSEC